MIRVLIADDSPTSRELVAAVIRRDRGLALVGQAVDGEHAVELVLNLRPDVVLMDLHMPRLDGLGATRRIMTIAPTPIVVMTADAEARTCHLTLQALEAGALHLVPKPGDPTSDDFPDAADGLTQAAKAMAGVKLVRRRTSFPTPPALPPNGLPFRGPRHVVAIATSTGGPTALQCVLKGLPRDFPAPVLVVQHITGFTPGLINWLKSVCAIRVKVAEHGERLADGCAYFAPDDFHLGVGLNGTVVLNQGPPVGGFRPSGDALFGSVAAAYGSRVVAVIMTGMGDDGVDGLRAVRRAGGWVIAQDETTSVVYGMPGAAVAAGVVDVIVPLEEIGRRLLGANRP